MKKLITILILIFTITVPVYAYEVELEPEMITAINTKRMTKQEQHKVKVYVNRFAHKQKGKTKSEILIQAITKISQRATYLAYNHNPSDVLTGQADCQGYSIMLYLMLTKSNVECKIVYNKTHMWNMVKLSDSWQQVDLTAMDEYLYIKY